MREEQNIFQISIDYQNDSRYVSNPVIAIVLLIRDSLSEIRRNCDFVSVIPGTDLT